MRQLRNQIIGLLAAGLVMLIAGAGTVTWLWRGVWVSKEKAILALENSGFKDIVILDKDVTFIEWRGCGSDDTAAFQARAVNANGRTVEVTVCSAWRKGATVRTP